MKTNAKRYGDGRTALVLTDKAADVYAETDPLDIYEIETEDGPRYDLDGVLCLEGLTAEEVSEALEDLGSYHDELDVLEA